VVWKWASASDELDEDEGGGGGGERVFCLRACKAAASPAHGSSLPVELGEETGGCAAGESVVAKAAEILFCGPAGLDGSVEIMVVEWVFSNLHPVWLSISGPTTWASLC
jgi:hypothetical protein